MSHDAVGVRAFILEFHLRKNGLESCSVDGVAIARILVPVRLTAIDLGFRV